MLDKPATRTSVDIFGPLSGYRVVEFAGVGPGLFTCMMLADMGADLVALDCIGANTNVNSVAGHGRKIIELNLKDGGTIEQVLDLLAGADALIEGFRPGVMERLGLGPDLVLARNPKLVYGRMTGWVKDGRAGKDINYISPTGTFATFGQAFGPVPPLNLVSDIGGGAPYLVLGVLAALFQASYSGKGQVLDAAICDGVNFLDGGARFYGVYECACGHFVSIGSTEPQFHALLRKHAELSETAFDSQLDHDGWPALKKKFTQVFKSKTRDEWCKIMEGTDICFACVLTMEEALEHPHMAAPNVFMERHGVTPPAPARRFSLARSAIREPVEIGDMVRAWMR